MHMIRRFNKQRGRIAERKYRRLVKEMCISAGHISTLLREQCTVSCSKSKRPKQEHMVHVPILFMQMHKFPRRICPF